MKRTSTLLLVAIMAAICLGLGSWSSFLSADTSAPSPDVTAEDDIIVMDEEELAFQEFMAFIIGDSSFGIEAVLPDLTITSLSAPDSASQGATISVIHTTKNIGTLAAASSTSKFYLCTNNVADASGYRNQQSVSSLAIGASKTLTNTTFSVPADQPLGTNYIVVICGGGVTESDKSNNTNSIPIVITQ